MADSESEDASKFVIADSDSDGEVEGSIAMKNHVEKVPVPDESEEILKEEITSQPMEQTLSKSQRKRMKKKNKKAKQDEVVESNEVQTEKEHDVPMETNEESNDIDQDVKNVEKETNSDLGVEDKEEVSDESLRIDHVVEKVVGDTEEDKVTDSEEVENKTDLNMDHIESDNVTDKETKDIETKSDVEEAKIVQHDDPIIAEEADEKVDESTSNGAKPEAEEIGEIEEARETGEIKKSKPREFEEPKDIDEIEEVGETEELKEIEKPRYGVEPVEIEETETKESTVTEESENTEQTEDTSETEETGETEETENLQSKETEDTKNIEETNETFESNPEDNTQLVETSNEIVSQPEFLEESTTLESSEHTEVYNTTIPQIIADDDDDDDDVNVNVNVNDDDNDDDNPFAIAEHSVVHSDDDASIYAFRAASPEDTVDETFDTGSKEDPQLEEVIVEENPEEMTMVTDSEAMVESASDVPVYRYVEVASKKDKLKDLTRNFVFGLAVVDFDHLSGPELQYWLDDEVVDGSATVEEKVEKFGKVWPYFAFQALPDGVHKFDETFTQFSLCYDEILESGVEYGDEKVRVIGDVEGGDVDEVTDGKDEVILVEDPNQGIVTLFGCACIRQVDSDMLEEEKKRSIVQKSVVLITRAPMTVQIKEKLSIVTKSWFEQYDFHDVEILKMLYENLSGTYNANGFVIEDDVLFDEQTKVKGNDMKVISESDFFMCIDFQSVVSKMKRNLLVLVKCLMLAEYKILVFSKDLNELSNCQYAIVGLISNLIMNLEDSGYPPLDKHMHEIKEKAKSLKSSDRSSMLKFLGLPLRIFGEGSFFQPYLTLQQISYITNPNTRSFLVGSSNDVLLDHKNEWFDMVVYLDEKDNGMFNSSYTGCKVEIFDSKLRELLALSWDDKKFIDAIITSVEKPPMRDISANNSTDNIALSKTINSNISIEKRSYLGGDDYIRTNIEDYIIGFLSSVKYDNFVKHKGQIQDHLSIYRNDISKFNDVYVNAFKETRVYREWNAISEDELFSFFLPHHANRDEPVIREAEKAVGKLKSLFSWKKK